jgi:AcrR family transcriptional regulator
MPPTPPNDEPRWRRRKEARPAEILDAALTVFAAQGFAAARLDDIARRAGVSKAALYLYFETKEDLFRAAARSLGAPQLTAIASAIETLDPPFAEAVPALLARAAAVMSEGRPAQLARMVIGESRNFPDLARIWQADVVDRMLGVVTGLIARGQDRGEIAPGDPRLHAFTIMGPLVLGALYNVVFGELGEARCDLAALAAQHARTVVAGLSLKPLTASES